MRCGPGKRASTISFCFSGTDPKVTRKNKSQKGWIPQPKNWIALKKKKKKKLNLQGVIQSKHSLEFSSNNPFSPFQQKKKQYFSPLQLVSENSFWLVGDETSQAWDGQALKCC